MSEQSTTDEPAGVETDAGADVLGQSASALDDQPADLALAVGPLALLEVGGVTQTDRSGPAIQSPWSLPVIVQITCGGRGPTTLELTPGKPPGTMDRAPLDIAESDRRCDLLLVEDGIADSAISDGVLASVPAGTLDEGETRTVEVNGLNSVLRVVVTYRGVEIETAVADAIDNGPDDVTIDRDELALEAPDELGEALPPVAAPLHRDVPLTTTVALGAVFAAGLGYSIVQSRRPL